MESIIQIVVIAGLIPVYVIPFCCVYRGASFRKGMLLTWGLQVLWAVVFSIPFYEIVWWYKPELTEGIPEGNNIIGAIVIGWLSGIIVSFMAITMRKYIKKAEG